MAESEYQLPAVGQNWPEDQQGFLIGVETEASAQTAAAEETPANTVKKVASKTATINGEQLGLSTNVDVGSAFGAGHTYERPRQMPGDEASAIPENDVSTSGHSRLILGVLATGLLATGMFAAGKSNPDKVNSLLAKAEKIGLTWRCSSNFDSQQNNLLEGLAQTRQARVTVMVGRSINTGRDTAATINSEDGYTKIKKPLRLICKYNPDKKRFISISPIYLDDISVGTSDALTTVDASEDQISVPSGSELKAKQINVYMPDETESYPYGDDYNSVDGLVDSKNRHYAYTPN